MSNTQRRIGAHLSTSGGIDKAVEQAYRIGANSLQIFSGSPRMWRRTPLANIDVDKIAAKQQELDVKPIFTHALYLVNLASDNPELVAKSMAALKHDLEFNAYIKGAGVIVHVGSHQGRGWEAVREQLVTLISQLLAETPTESHFLIENAAGQKGKVGGDLTEIAWLLKEIQSPRLGWCFDTCHAFAASYALDTSPQLLASAEAEQRITELGLWDTLKVIHVNDSRDLFGSGRDRHANLTEGQISEASFRHFLNLESVKPIPLIMEVPGFDQQGPDAENIKLLKRLLQ